MLDQLLIGSTFTSAMVYLFTRIRVYMKCDEDPMLILDSNDNEIVTVSDDQKDIIIITKRTKQSTCDLFSR